MWRPILPKVLVGGTKPSHAKPMGEASCNEIPSLLSSFVDTFVDFSVSGLFLLPPPPPPPRPLVEFLGPVSGATSALHLLHAPPPLQTRLPSPNRLIAIGDLHGDLEKSKQALRLANLIDASDKWIGGSTTVVQVGDVLDRGGEELKILYFLEKLKREAAKTGGKIVTMNGNHEIMNVVGDFELVTEKALEEFKVWGYWFSIGNKMKGHCEGLEKPKDPFEGLPMVFHGVKKEFFDGFRARIAAFRPGGPISTRFLSQNVTVLVVGDSIFVHGGLLPQHVSYGLEKINEEMRDWINGVNGRFLPVHCRGNEGVVWSRKFSNELAKNCDCSTLEHVLATIPGVKRMIMGHTIQKVGINGVCDDRAIRIDVGMSKGCKNGFPEVLEITENSGLRILTSNPVYKDKKKSSGLVMRKEEGRGMLLPKDRPKQVEVKAY